MRTARWPLLVFDIGTSTDTYKEGRPKDYARQAKGYDREKLSAAALTELAYLLSESEDPAGAAEVGKVFVKRFADTEKPLLVARVAG